MTSPEESVKPFLSVKKYPRRISSTMNAMRQEGVGTDIVLICKEKKFPAHQLVLSAGSPYFKKMFESEFKESFTKRIDFSYVKESTLKSVLDFLYLSEPKLAEESLEDLMEIHDMSHLFGVTELSDFCWKLIKRHITIENYIIIWNMRILYTDEYCFEEILKFILENFKTVIERESFLTLNGSQMTLLLQRVRDKGIPVDDYLFERLVQWIKTDEENRREMVKVFYYLNFEMISKECVEWILESNENLFLTGCMRTFFDIHVFPKLKNKQEVEEMKNPYSVVKSPRDILSLKYFCFGHQLELKNNVICDKYDALKITNICCPEKRSHILRLPVTLNEVHFCFFSTSVFYFVKKEITSLNLYLVAYDWKSNTVIFDVPIPICMHVLTGCSTEDVVYLIGRPEKNGINTVVLIQCYTQRTQTWSSIKLKDAQGHDEIITSVNLKDALYILCFKKECLTRRRNSYHHRHNNNEVILGRDQNPETWTFFMYIVQKNIGNHFMTSSFRIEGQFHLPKNLITVHKDKLYAFFPYERKMMYYFYDSIIDHWNRFEMPIKNYVGRPIKCINENNQEIFFYTAEGQLIYFNGDKKELNTLPFKIPFAKHNQNFVNMANDMECEIIVISTDDFEN